MSKIVCPSCRESEAFTFIRHIAVTTDVNGNGEATGGSDFANELRSRWLSCGSCGHAWKTTRYINVEVDVR